MIKAIETVYKGYRFRSRLEARWAVFFDACGYDWEYEVEGYHLPCGTYYLPDFRISGKDSNGDYNIFLIEVKPNSLGVEDKKANAFQNALLHLADYNDDYDELDKFITGYGDFIIVDGTPDRKLYTGTMPFNGSGGRMWMMEPWYRDRPSFWNDGDDYMEILKMLGANEASFDCFSPVNEARSARFEHGETPR